MFVHLQVVFKRAKINFIFVSERPPSAGDPVINCESFIAECGTQDIENRSCEQSHGDTADGHAQVIVLVCPSDSPNNRHHPRAWQEN